MTGSDRAGQRPSKTSHRNPTESGTAFPTPFATNVTMALEQSELSPRELATRFTDTKGYYVSEPPVYRLLKAYDLIPSPAFIVIKAADVFTDKTTAPNQLWQDADLARCFGREGRSKRPFSGARRKMKAARSAPANPNAKAKATANHVCS